MVRGQKEDERLWDFCVIYVWKVWHRERKIRFGGCACGGNIGGFLVFGGGGGAMSKTVEGEVLGKGVRIGWRRRGLIGVKIVGRVVWQGGSGIANER